MQSGKNNAMPACATWTGISNSTSRRAWTAHLIGWASATQVDVDVLDFTDAPLAENTDGRNLGPSLEQFRKAPSLAGQDPRLRALSVGELNPTRAAGVPEVLLRFVDVLAATLAARDARAYQAHGFTRP
jgi:hypothetical protein